ncbi:MAG: hypothetical protein RL095_472 [Verrucomicrobiota bacterium]|jgi:hypothetical protein
MKPALSLRLLSLANQVEMAPKRQWPKLAGEIMDLIMLVREHIESLKLDEKSQKYYLWEKLINEIHAAHEFLEDEKNPEESALALRSAESYL